MAGTSEKTPEQIQAIVDAGKNTQFGAKDGNKTAGELGLSPGSVRKNIRYLLKQPPVLQDDKKWKIILPTSPTAAQIGAAREIEDWINAEPSERMRRAEYITDQVDGKLHQVNVNADLERFETMTEEELHEYNRKLDERIASASGNRPQQPAAGSDTARADGAQGGSGAATGEGEGTNEIAAAPGSDQPISDL